GGRGGGGQEGGGWQGQRFGGDTALAGGKEADRLPFPSRPVEDGLAVGGEPRRGNVAAAEGNAMKLRLRGARHRPGDPCPGCDESARAGRGAAGKDTRAERGVGPG